MPQNYIALDLETTGLDASRDRIIEIGCARLQEGEIVDEWSSLVNPGRRLPFAITQLTGITDRDLAGAPPLNELVDPLQRFVGDYPLIAHNIRFDLGFLREAGISLANPGLDTFDLASIILPGQSSYSLGSLARSFDIELIAAHRALADARATALLFAVLQQEAAKLPLPTLIEINRLAASNDWIYRSFFVAAEKAVARTALLKGWQRKALESGDLGPLFSYDAQLDQRYDPALEPVEQPVMLDVDLLAAFLEPNGPLAAAFAGYEHREPQVAMLRAVAEAFNNADHLLIEAGTGTGKSLAYLLPAITWAAQNRQRVVISTNTINLQDQLVTKDIPDLQGIFSQRLAHQEATDTQKDTHYRQLAEQVRGLRVSLLKGRSNYLCPRRLDAMRSRADLNADELRVLARVLVWLSQTTTGDRGELFLPSGRDRAIWGRLATESGTCTAERCEVGQHGRCFFYRNRRRAEAAHIIVVNHALLLSDVAVGNRVLPEYHHLIVDEAHHLENATTQQLSFRTSEDGLERLLNDIYPDGGQERSGILYDIRRRSSRGLSSSTQQTLERYISKAQRRTETCRDSLRSFFTLLAEFLNTGQKMQGPYSQRIRLDSRIHSQPMWSQVEIAWDEVDGPMYELYEALEILRAGLVELEETGVSGWDDLLADLSSIASQVEEVYQQLHAAIFRPDPGGIYWVEVDSTNRRLSIHSAPLHVGPLVETHLLHQKDNVILTSATLRTAGSYDYIQERLHAYEARTTTVGSPFDYRSSTLVFIPTDVSPPHSRPFQSQVEAAVRSLTQVLAGRTLVLFTSYSQLRQTAEAIGPGLAAAGFNIYQQGSGGSRRQLLESFRSNQRSILLGTRSFWEGVDVVGPALSGLILVKLPFAVPSDPIVAARAETFDEPFYQYSVPDAILRFRQGFGRLIRSRQDRGICVIMDNRVLTKRYGSLFLDSLPDCTVQRAPLSLLSRTAENWLGSA
jgi:DNA polymerase-3 subunit epsilon/ATP-dependent DNA helicase DinG